MTKVNVHEAKTQLSRLLAEVEEGATIIIARNGKPIAELVPVTKQGKPLSGLWRDRLVISEDLDEEDAEINRLFAGGSD
jgi:prevent-host-death family protein